MYYPTALGQREVGLEKEVSGLPGISFKYSGKWDLFLDGWFYFGKKIFEFSDQDPYML